MHFGVKLESVLQFKTRTKSSKSQVVFKNGQKTTLGPSYEHSLKHSGVRCVRTVLINASYAA